MKLKKIFFFLLCSTAMVLNAQSLERKVVASGGTFATSANLQLDYTIGDLVVATGSAGTVIVTQGFQQGNTGSVGVTPPKVKTDLAVFPNPTQNEVFLKGSIEGVNNATLEIWDILGKKLGTVEVIIKDEQIDQKVDMSGFTAGQYQLSLQGPDGLIGSFKVRKID